MEFLTDPNLARRPSMVNLSDGPGVDRSASGAARGKSSRASAFIQQSDTVGIAALVLALDGVVE